MTINASTITQALQAIGAPTGTAAVYNGSPDAMGVSTGRLANFPVNDEDGDEFLILSSGRVTDISGFNTSGSQGRDLGPTGTTGDTAVLTFTIPVTPAAVSIGFDFTFLSEEYPEYVGSIFNDRFSATLDGVEIALDTNSNPITVNNNFFDGSLSASGTFFDGMTPSLSVRAPLTANATSVTLELSIRDVGDGIYDSAAFIDNLQLIEPQQVLFLQFDADTVVWDGFILSSSFNMPGYQATDTFKNDVLTHVRSIFSDYLVDVTLQRPSSGEYTTIFIGGDETNVPKKVGVGNNTLGIANDIDEKNENLSDNAMVFTGNFTTMSVGLLSQVIAHEAGHLFGLRHVDGMSELMYPYADAGSTTISGPHNLAEIDAASGAVTPVGGTQNSREELARNIGLRNESIVVTKSSIFDSIKKFFNFSFSNLQSTVHDARIAIYNHQSDVLSWSPLTASGGTGNASFSLPVAEGDQIIYAAKSQPGGEYDIFSMPSELGLADFGALDDDAFDFSQFAVDVPNGNEPGAFSFNVVQETASGVVVVGSVAAVAASTASPDAVPDMVAVLRNGQIDIDVRANDTHPENQLLDIAIATAAGNGTAAVNPDRSIRYTPAVGFVGTDTFTYRATDTDGNTDTATVTVLVVESLTPTVSIAATDADKAEGNGQSTPFTFTVTRSGNITGVTTVEWSVTGKLPNVVYTADTGAATAADFGGTAPSGSLTFAAGETSRTVTVTVVDDDRRELAEIFTVVLANPINGTLAPGASDAVGTIRNDDQRPPFLRNIQGVSEEVYPTTYSGPVSYLKWELLGLTSNEVVAGSDENDFINLLAGDDAVNAGNGDDVIDGGTGSNFMTGGAGFDTFFIDGRGSGTTWGTITDWSSTEHLSLWGWQPGVSTMQWVSSAGAPGFEGVTMHGDLNNDGTIDVSMTWSGRGAADLPAPIQFDNLLWFKGS